MIFEMRENNNKIIKKSKQFLYCLKEEVLVRENMKKIINCNY